MVTAVTPFTSIQNWSIGRLKLSSRKLVAKDSPLGKPHATLLLVEAQSLLPILYGESPVGKDGDCSSLYGMAISDRGELLAVETTVRPSQSDKAASR